MQLTQQSGRATRSVQPATRRSRRTPPVAPKPATEPTLNAFLNTAFAPVSFGIPHEIADQQAIERSFFASAANLCQLYGWTDALLTSDYPYPLNIWQSYCTLGTLVGQVEGDEVKLAIVQEDQIPAMLVTYSSWEADTYLYYIPLEPYWNQLQQKRHKKRTRLIESIMAFFLKSGVPDCSNDGNYVGYQAEYLIHMYEEEYEEESTPEECLEMVRQQKLENRKVDLAMKRIRHPKALAELSKRLVRFRPQSKLDEQLYSVGQMVLALSRTHPGRSVMDSDYGHLIEREEYAEGVIELDQYLSFIWNTGDGCRIYEQIVQDLDDCISAGEASGSLLCVQRFDTPQTASRHPTGLDFEKSLFNILNEFTAYLYSVETATQHEEHN